MNGTDESHTYNTEINRVYNRWLNILIILTKPSIPSTNLKIQQFYVKHCSILLLRWNNFFSYSPLLPCLVLFSGGIWFVCYIYVLSNVLWLTFSSSSISFPYWRRLSNNKIVIILNLNYIKKKYSDNIM